MLSRSITVSKARTDRSGGNATGIASSGPVLASGLVRPGDVAIVKGRRGCLRPCGARSGTAVPVVDRLTVDPARLASGTSAPLRAEDPRDRMRTRVESRNSTPRKRRRFRRSEAREIFIAVPAGSVKSGAPAANPRQCPSLCCSALRSDRPAHVRGIFAARSHSVRFSPSTRDQLHWSSMNSGR
jgi:hypothetical protein